LSYEHHSDEDHHDEARRGFLARCGRYAIVTGPAITVMMSVSEKAIAQVVTSRAGGTTGTGTTGTGTTGTGTTGTGTTGTGTTGTGTTR
jgi:hypothetical protein